MKLSAVDGREVASAIVLAVTSAAVYFLLVDVVGPALNESDESAEIGAMWAVVSTIFVFRGTLDARLADTRTRLFATAMSLAVCLTYLLIFPVTAIGIGAVIGAGCLLAALLGHTEDAVLTGITSTVVLVVADLGDPSTAWMQPLLRLLDTAIGIGAGLSAAGVFASIARERTAA